MIRGVQDFSEYTTFPFELPVTARTLDPPVDVEPARFGEDGRHCHGCAPDEQFDWVDERWRLSAYRPSPLVGVMILTSRAHHDSFADLPDHLAAELGPVLGRVERAILGLGDIGRVHVHRWGDGGSHFHVWFYPRPYGVLQLRGTFLPVWGMTMDPLPEPVVDGAARRIAEALAADSGRAVPRPD